MGLIILYNGEEATAEVEMEAGTKTESFVRYAIEAAAVAAVAAEALRSFEKNGIVGDVKVRWKQTVVVVVVIPAV